MIRDIPSKATTGYLRATIDNQTLSWDNVKEIIKQYTQIVNYHNVSVPLYSSISIDMFLFTTGVYESETDIPDKFLQSGPYKGLDGFLPE